MTDKQILQKAIEKADIFVQPFNNDPKTWASHFIDTNRASELYLGNDFAYAVGYNLHDLYKWLKEGKNPFEYIEKFL